MEQATTLYPRTLELGTPDELPEPPFLEVRTGLMAGGGEIVPRALDARE
jgi:hypothetical protein